MGVWSSGGNLIVARYGLAGAGTLLAGLSFGGEDSLVISKKTEEYNGTSWSSGGNLNTARRYLAGCGIQTAGLSFGGWDTSYSAITEEYSTIVLDIIYPTPSSSVLTSIGAYDGSLILYDNILGNTVLTASSTASEYDVDNLKDWKVYTQWKPNTTGSHTITVDCGSAKAANAMGIIGHNLYSTGSTTVLVEYSEMEISVLDIMKHPTSESRYWQSMREQNVIFQELVMLS